MKERVSQSLRFQGFVLVLVALLQGVLIIAGVGRPEAQGRAHIEIFLLAFLVILIGQNVISLALTDKLLKIMWGSTLGAAWFGAAHAIVVASTGATSIHVKGTASPAVEKLVVVLGIAPGPLGLAAIGLVIYGFIAKKKSKLP